MFITFSGDLCGCLTNSLASRLLCCILPVDRYAITSEQINLTVQAACWEIVQSFKKLGEDGLVIQDLPSMGGGPVPFRQLFALFSMTLTLTLTLIRCWNFAGKKFRFPGYSSTLPGSGATGRRSSKSLILIGTQTVTRRGWPPYVGLGAFKLRWGVRASRIAPSCRFAGSAQPPRARTMLLMLSQTPVSVPDFGKISIRSAPGSICLLTPRCRASKSAPSCPICCMFGILASAGMCWVQV